MNNQEPAVIQFVKEVDGQTFNCNVEQCSDGSVYVASDEFELVCEFCDDALDKAIGQLIALGYVRVPSQ